MNKTFATLLMLLFLSNFAFAQSQNYKAFKVEILPGYAIPMGTGGGEKGGFCLSFEPKYNINDNIAVGIKAEAAALAAISNSSSGIVSVVTSYSLTGEYYLGDRMVRPFAGIGVGSYGAIIFDTDGFETLVKGKSVIGFAPRAGLQIGHFRLEAAYNLVQDSNYLSLKSGFTIGGGRK